MIRPVILMLAALAALVATSVVSAAVEEPTIERLSLKAVPITHPTHPRSDYCRLDVVLHGDFSSLSEALEAERVEFHDLMYVVARYPTGFPREIDITPLSVTASEMHATIDDDGWFFRYGNHHTPSSGVNPNMPYLATIDEVGVFVTEGTWEGPRVYRWFFNVQPPREATNVEALFNKCFREIELAHERQERQRYVTQHQLAIEMARETAEIEVEFLNGEITMMEIALVDIRAAVDQAGTVIDEALERRRVLIGLEQTFAAIINAFWTDQADAFSSFTLWADEQLANIDQLIDDATDSKAELEKMETAFEAELEATRERARQAAEELQKTADLAASGTGGD